MTFLFRAFALVVILGLATAARAAPPASSLPSQDRDLGPYSVYGPGLTYRQPDFYVGPLTTSFRVRTSVSVPDRGTALVAGYSSAQEGRSEFGTPVLGKVPLTDRAFRNVGYGRSVSRQTISAGVRIIDLREEELRQTGVGR
jgi:Bacterial type II and III secretion system protein